MTTIALSAGAVLQGLASPVSNSSAGQGACEAWWWWWMRGSEAEEEFLPPGQPGGPAEWMAYCLAGLCLCCVFAALLPTCVLEDSAHGTFGASAHRHNACTIA